MPPLFGDLTAEDFLANYWQKQPLLIRNALPGWTSPLRPEDLAGLACEPEASSRIIQERGGDYPWQLHYGPFDPEDFEALPETHWTLLVQEVDRWVPEVAALLERFRFVPNWRLDDVMVSYAPEHGGVGAHIDNYDVFLLQGLGHRRWQISHTPVEEEQLVPDLDVRVLADFEPDAEWVLGPGDLLYLPPRIPHYGVAEDDCMTYSIGFRAPSQTELAQRFATFIAETQEPDLRYSDPHLTPTDAPGRLAPEARRQIRTLLRSLVEDDDRLDVWFGQFITEPKRGYVLADEAPSIEDLRAHFADDGYLVRAALPQLAYLDGPDGGVTLFASGEAIPLDDDLAFAAPLVTGTALLTADTLGPHLDDDAFVDLLATLIELGALYPDYPEEDA